MAAWAAGTTMKWVNKQFSKIEFWTGVILWCCLLVVCTELWVGEVVYGGWLLLLTPHPQQKRTKNVYERVGFVDYVYRVPLHLLRKQKLETRNDLYYSISKHRPEFRSTDQKQSKSKNMTNGDCSSDAIREGLLGPTSDEAVSSIFIQRASNSCCRVSLAAAW